MDLMTVAIPMAFPWKRTLKRERKKTKQCLKVFEPQVLSIGEKETGPSQSLGKCGI